MANPATVGELTQTLRRGGYLADRGLATAMFVALSLNHPVLLEGEAGVGKTEVAKALAPALGAELVRLQCYEGIDAHQALYEWDYTRQLLYARLLQEGRELREDAADEIFGPRFLVERPLLQAVRAGDRAVLLIDEIDRADDEFEAFLLEMLSDFQVTVPELGTIRAERPPAVVLTSNRTRELHDALKRRCLYHWIDYPSLDREVEILAARAHSSGRPRPARGGGRRPHPHARSREGARRRRDHRVGQGARVPGRLAARARLRRRHARGRRQGSRRPRAHSGRPGAHPRR